MANILTNEDGSQQLVDESGIFLTDEEAGPPATVFDAPPGFGVPRIVTLADPPLPILGRTKLVQPGVPSVIFSGPFVSGMPSRLPRGQVYHPHGWHFVR